MTDNMTDNITSISKDGIIADAVAIQERDGFRANGWKKIIAPAKVNLYLAIGDLQKDGYHRVTTVLHALNIHDTLYIRATPEEEKIDNTPRTVLVARDDVDLPEITSEENLATKAVIALAESTSQPISATALDLRIEKSIPFQAGLGGASSDAAAALVGAALLWGIDPTDPVLEETARTLGADVAFFLHGGCSYLEGRGDQFVKSLVPSKQAIALVKPYGGVSTSKAYAAFDANPVQIPTAEAEEVSSVLRADEVPLFNNLAPAAFTLMPELSDVWQWLDSQPGIEGALLCGSGATTFALCDNFQVACSVVAAARKRGWWARATNLGSARVSSFGTGVL